MGKKFNPEYREAQAARLKLPKCRICNKRNRAGEHKRCLTYAHRRITELEKQSDLSRSDKWYLEQYKYVVSDQTVETDVFEDWRQWFGDDTSMR